MFLLEFEKALVKYLYDSPLRVKQVFFGDGKFSFIDAFSKVKTMPYVHISRSIDSDSLGKSVVVHDLDERRRFYPIKMDYTIYCVVEKSVEMLQFMSDLRFYTSSHPNIYVFYPPIEPKRIMLGDTVYHGTGYDGKYPLDPEFRDLYCATVDKELYYMKGAKRIPYFQLSDGKCISYYGNVKLSDSMTILDARDFIKIPEPVRVEFAYMNVTLDEIQNSIDEKGPVRSIQMKFHAEMFTEELSTMPTFKSVKVIVRAMPRGEEFVAIELSEESDEV